ncbi:protein of unknown function DUF814 [Alkalidesulfovibrio alkalitolerans DSM 16529]|uniref:NFACT RNA-binding domain-containing protein n=1 Tax=Alkalidesulfovibrio alkalitolerans DSM 16529 TaxID=1121439 RepID=S7ULN9_9BACT|nr:NFACT RNA binding domain-containing protein [Alkalidesulfovibrio alkalitolerans]EPR34774.1 protein of unknown function DUF814 [Alkalidesulfovibrio alkalitolerans DSM 16529]
MDAVFFRAFAACLAPRLTGARCGKVFEPAKGCFVFALKKEGEAFFLLFHPHKARGLFCLTPAKPPMPHDPGAFAMWLRKRVTGSRVVECRADWPSLSFALVLAGRGALVLDLRQGARHVDVLPEDFGRPPPWPSLDAVLGDEDIWREFPHVSPGLRRHLGGLPRVEAVLELERLAAGECGEFWTMPEGHAPVCWPLCSPAAVRREDALLAARSVAEPRFYEMLSTDASEASQREKAAGKRRDRLLKLLARDEERLVGLLVSQRAAEALQANLSALRSRVDGAQPERLTLAHPDGGLVEVEIDPRLGAAGTMQALFSRAAKGRRGLAHVARRRQEVLREYETAFTDIVPTAREADGNDASDVGPAGPGSSLEKPAQTLPKRFQGLAIKVFVTTDGFLAVRGKSAAANHGLVTRAARPHDLWLHVKDAAGAHVVIVRDHPGQEVPERSLLEAASLAALSSPLRDAAWADVLLAEARAVRTIKGAAKGLVRLDKPDRVLRVRLDKELEDRLAVQ